MVSDVDSGIHFLDHRKIPENVVIDPQGPLYHSNKNAYRRGAFDKLTSEDAKWAVGKIAALTEEQLKACFAAGTVSWRETQLILEKFLIRRDDLVEKFDLVQKYGLMRPNGIMENYTGLEPLELTDHNGNKYHYPMPQ